MFGEEVNWEGEVEGTIMMRGQGGARRYRLFEWGHSGMGSPESR